MADKLKPMTPAWIARQERWKHNSFHGHAAMMMQNARSILESRTATDEAKDIANRIYMLASQLKANLKDRRSGT